MAAGGFIYGAGEFDFSSCLDERQPDPVLHLGTVASQSPGHYRSLDPSTCAEQLPTRLREAVLRGLNAYAKRAQWQRAEVVVEQPAAIVKAGIPITEQSVEAG